MKKILIAFIVGIIPALAFAQAPVQTFPLPRTISATGTTIVVTNKFQSALVAAPNRVNCIVQNNGTHNMFVYFGTLANATTSNSIILAANWSISCNNYGVVTTQDVNITGTSGDAFVANQQ